MKATLVEKIESYIQCFNCGDANSHCSSPLDPGVSFGPWYCNECGTGIRGYVDGNGNVEIEEAEYRTTPTYVLLRVDAQDGAIFLVVKGEEYRHVGRDESNSLEESNGDIDFSNTDEFFYRFQCEPFITLRNTVAIFKGDKVASDNFFHYVTTKFVPFNAYAMEEQSPSVEALSELFHTDINQDLLRHTRIANRLMRALRALKSFIAGNSS